MKNKLFYLGLAALICSLCVFATACGEKNKEKVEENPSSSVQESNVPSTNNADNAEPKKEDKSKEEKPKESKPSS